VTNFLVLTIKGGVVLTVGKVGSVLVLGGGVAGIQASLDLAGSGYYVYLVERSPAIGGVMAQLDKTFPTNDCSMCILSPKLVESGRHTNIRLITNTSVVGLEGKAGDFKVTLRSNPRYVEADKCVGCGLCAEKCPVKVPDLFNERIGNRKAIYNKYAQAVPNTYAIDKDQCLFLTRGQTKAGKDICKLCEKVCETGAINFDQQPSEELINVGAVIVASGFKRFDPSGLDYYGYGRFKNVVTSMELERILSASGPYQGHLIRPGDRAEPRRVAWIQCVGSRNLTGAGMSYCSAVCCTYAVKEAIVAKEHSVGDVDAAIFYIDMRAFGKDFEAYLDRAKTEYGVRFIKSRIYEVEELPSGSLRMRYADEFGKVSTEEFDMVVLSVALRPADGTVELAKVLGIELNSHGFSNIPGMDITQSSREGIFVCGAVTGPQDIPDTVVQASAAAGSAAAFLAGARGSNVVEKDFPPERDTTGEDPRVGVFVCRCGINIGNVVDVTRVKESIAGAKSVEYAGEFLYACSQDSQEKVKEAIEKYGLNRIVVASCTPRTHEELFRQTLRESGLNPFLFEMANIREHCSWVHSSNPEAATRKAMDLVSRAVQKVRRSESLEELTLSINRDALVIGGGVSGINAALELAGQGIKVFLLEKTERLGGLTLRIKANISGFNIRNYLEDLIGKVNSNPLIEVITGANVDGAWGHVGNFTTRVITGEGAREINHGVAIIAIGGRESRPVEYLYGQDSRIMTGLQLDGAISNEDPIVTGAKIAVFIQCVGSRGDERSYCSRMCCSETVKNALELKELNPQIKIYVLYRDIRTFGFREDFYTLARQKGIVFIRFQREKHPEIRIVGENGAGRLEVVVTDTILDQPLLIEPDIISLAAAIDPPEDAAKIAQAYKVPLNAENFFLEAHMKLRPVDFNTNGVYLCGLAHGPKFIEESIAQGKAAASRAMMVLSKQFLVTGGAVSAIDSKICSGCKVCLGICPYGSITFDEKDKVASVNPFLCQGCGTCAAACPTGACTAKNFRDNQILAEIAALCV